MTIIFIFYILAMFCDCTVQQIAKEQHKTDNAKTNDPFNDFEWLPQFRNQYANHCEAASANYSSGHGSCFYIVDPKSLLIGKLELLSFDPLVIMFHSVLSDTYINEILNITHDELEPATVVEYADDDTHVEQWDDYGVTQDPSRVAKSAWLDENSVIDQYITWLYTEITGIELENSELMNVIHYKPGGHYAPHYDEPEIEKLWLDPVGNRLATIITFLHEPERGGHTIFPHLRLSLKPTKGSILLWFNILTMGEYDPRLLHAGCPVWEGIKTIGTIWVRRGGNELVVRCPQSHTWAFEPSSFQQGLIRFIK